MKYRTTLQRQSFVLGHPNCVPEETDPVSQVNKVLCHRTVSDHVFEDRRNRVSWDSQILCRRTAKPCVPGQLNPVYQNGQTRSGLRCGQKPVGKSLRSFSPGPAGRSAQAGCPRCPRHSPARSSASGESAPRAPDKLRSPLPAGPRPGAVPGYFRAPCGLTGPSAGRAQGRQQRPEQRPAPAAHRPPAPPAPPPRSTTVTGTAPPPETRQAAAPVRHQAQDRQRPRERDVLRSAALGGRQHRRPAPARLPPGEGPSSPGAAVPRALSRYCGATAEPCPRGPTRLLHPSEVGIHHCPGQLYHGWTVLSVKEFSQCPT